MPLCFAKNAEVLVQPETPLVRRIFVHSREFNFFSQILIEPKNCLYDIIKAATFVESLVSPPNNNWEEEEEYTEIFICSLCGFGLLKPDLLEVPSFLIVLYEMFSDLDLHFLIQLLVDGRHCSVSRVFFSFFQALKDPYV